jgi:hypothetical protein
MTDARKRSPSFLVQAAKAAAVPARATKPRVRPDARSWRKTRTVVASMKNPNGTSAYWDAP